MHEPPAAATNTIMIPRVPLKARFGRWLFDKLSLIYGGGYDLPLWLDPLWRKLGVATHVWRPFYTPSYVCYETEACFRDASGVWWCETSYNPPVFPDLRRIIMDNPLQDSQGDNSDLRFIQEVDNVQAP